MGFFFQSEKPQKQVGPSKQSVDLLHRAGCNACPLDKAKCRTPKMEPSGQGSVYILGANPTKEADRAGFPIVGFTKEAFLKYLPRRQRGEIRYNNIVRTAAAQDINTIMIECCRPSIIADIEEQQPVAVIGIGAEVLKWAMPGMTNIRIWTGRRIPVKFGSHTCWFYPISDPVEVAKTQKYDFADSEEQFAWGLQVKQIFDWIDAGDKCSEPHTKEDARAGLIMIDGSNGQADVERIYTLLWKLSAEAHVGVDLETNRKRPYRKGAKILTASAAGRDFSLAFAIDHPRAYWTRKQREELHDIWADWLERAECRKIVHSLPFELEWSAVNYGLHLARAGRWEDTITQAWLLDERQKLGKPDALSLEILVYQYFGFNLKDLNVLDRADLENSPVELVLEYNAMDSKYHRALFLKQHHRLMKEGLIPQYENMLSRIPTCVLSQIKGVPISQRQVRKFKKYYEKNLEFIEADIEAEPAAKKFKKVFGRPFNPGNNKEVLLLIKEILGDSAINKQDKESSGLEVLQRLDDPIAALILEWRANYKGLSTYVMPVYAGDEKTPGSELVYDDGCIHPQIKTTATDTSRTASDEPNSQNWPKRKEGSKMVRGQIEPEEDERLVSFDFAGIQARNIAMESLDHNFIQSFWTGYDPHGSWTEWLCKKAGTDWKFVHKAGSEAAFMKDKALFKDARGVIKNGFVFPTFFGAAPRSISINLEVEQSIIEQMQEELFDEFPDVKVWQDRIKAHYQEHGWITGHTGIRHRAPRSPNQLINAPIQADEAWIVCDRFSALSRMAVPEPKLTPAKQRKFIKGDWRLQPNMEIHDDLTFIWKKKDIDHLAPIVIATMIDLHHIEWTQCVPIEIEMSVGKNWASQEEVGKFRSDTYLGKYQRKDYA